MEIHPLLTSAFQALDAEGVRWCLHKLSEDVDLAAPNGDIDLLVASSDFARAHSLLERRGFSPLCAFGHGPHRLFLAYDRAEDLWVKLDVVDELAFGGEHVGPTVPGSALLGRRQRVGDIFLPDADDAFWAMLLHCLLDKGRIARPHAEQLERLAASARPDGPLAAEVDLACPPGWCAKDIIERCRQGRVETVEVIVRAIRPRSLRRRLRARLAAARNWTLRVARRRLPGVRGGGACIALVGPDGAGKSTLAAGLESSFYFPTRTIYMGLYQRRTGSRRRLIVSAVALLSSLMRQWRRYVAALRHRAHGRLVVFDRYPYDARLPPRRPLGRLGIARRWLLGRALPAPDLVVVLDAPGELVAARKGEQEASVLERERQHYAALASRLPNAVLVDAARDPEAVRRDVVALAWQAYSARLRGRRSWKP